MSLFAPTKNQEPSKVLNSQYIRTENKADETVELVKPTQPEVK